MNPTEALSLINDKDKIPSFFKRNLKKWEEIFYSISLHTKGVKPSFKSLKSGGIIYPPGYKGKEYQRLFNEILFSRHPRENEDTRNWRFSQYKPITRAPFLQIIDVIQGAIFQDSNYTFTLPDEEDTRYLIDENNFDGYDLMGWFNNVAVPSIMDDPNGRIVVMPTQPFYEIKSNKVDLKLLFINSKDIIYSSSDSFIFKYGEYAYFIHPMYIYRYKYNSSESKYYLHTNDANGYYATMMNKLPVEVAGGKWDSLGVYESYLVKAQPVADDFVSSYSGEQMVDKESSHPYIIMAEEECSTCHGVGKVTVDCGDCPGGQELKECKKCGGKGTTSVNPGDRMNVPEDIMDKDLIKIVNPDININKYHHEKSNDIFNKILDALNLLKVDEAQSGVAKTIDEGRLHQFISKIANDLFDRLIYNTVCNIISFRHAVSINGNLLPAVYSFTLIKPTQYQIKTAADLLSEYTEGTKANLPVFIRQKMATDYLDKQYSGDLVLRKTGEFIMRTDALSVIPENEKIIKLANSEISKDDLVFSLRLPQMIREVVGSKGENWFQEASYDQILSEVQKAFQNYKTKKYIEYVPNNSE